MPAWTGDVNGGRMDKPKATRERILDAAEQVFALRGYDAASLGDVADRVGIRPQGIYNHYAGKWELWVAVLERLLDPLFEILDAALEGPPTPERGKRGLADWAPAVIDLLAEVCGGAPLNPEDAADRQTLLACDQILKAVRSLAETPAELSPAVSGAELLRLVLREAGGGTIPAPADPEAIEILGWLELPLDDAPALIVAGFNDRAVPEARNADAFLPNELRRRLHTDAPCAPLPLC